MSEIVLQPFWKWRNFPILVLVMTVLIIIYYYYYYLLFIIFFPCHRPILPG